MPWCPLADCACDAVWLGCCEVAAGRWFASKPIGRRRWPTDGHEWTLLGAAASFTAAAHVAR
eukprot:15454190-Alexandrium_andersonii.AAC.1